MSLEFIQSFLLWNAIIHSAVLIYWFLFVSFGSEVVYNLHTKFFKIEKETFYKVHYVGIVFYKLFIFLFFWLPYIVLLFL